MGLFERIIDRGNLSRAWDKIRSNHTVAGTDGVTEEEFQSRRKEMILQLQIELQSERYNTRPAKQVVLAKNGSERMISILCMRDKVVQQALCQELQKIYEETFAEAVYAYRRGRSAIQAVEQIEQWIGTGKYSYFLKTDISHFFDGIVQERLTGLLRRRISDEKVLRLVEICLHMRYLDDNGDLHDKTRGVYQGAILSPLLSNIYMTDFDCWLERFEEKCIRYSDDILILGQNRENLEKLLTEMQSFLEKCGLQLKESKTQIGKLEDGTEFLGYRFNRNGKMIPVKAYSHLEERLEECWLQNPELPIEEKMRACKEIIGGWEQYYKGDRTPGSIYEYVTVLSLYPKARRKELEEERFHYDNAHKDILRYMAAYWKDKSDYRNMLREYEQYFLILAFDREKAELMSEDVVEELVSQYQLVEINENEANFTEIMQLYTDAHCYNKARQILDWVKSRETSDEEIEEMPQAPSNSAWNGLNLSEKELQDFQELFVGREDLYKRAEVRENGKINYITVMQPLTIQEIKKHLAGNQTLATILQRNNHTVKYMIFDIDISKKEMLTSSGNQEIRRELLQLALEKAKEFQKICHNLGLNTYIEYSGGKGYHVWLFFEEWIATRYANLLQDIILSKQKANDPHLCVECFPNKTRVKEDKIGQGIKLPWGRHFQTGEYTYFVGKDFSFTFRQKEMLDGVARYSVAALKRVIAANTEEKLQTRNKRELHLKQFGEISEGVKTVLVRCGLMAHLCEKAKRTGYLSHGERLTILYVFGHLGNEGKEFVHQIMGYTLNYQYSVTEKYIKRLPEKPISCIKLRDQYKQVTAEIGCNCNFRRTPNCYPSPVLHVIKDANNVPDGVTIPASRKISQREEKQLPKTLNVHKQAEEMVHKMMELRKQERGIRHAIEKQEKGLNQILDDIGADCIELEMGILKRSRGAKGWEWSVEL